MSLYGCVFLIYLHINFQAENRKEIVNPIEEEPEPVDPHEMFLSAINADVSGQRAHDRYVGAIATYLTQLVTQKVHPLLPLLPLIYLFFCCN
jgi:hypothetical protein